MGVLLSGCGMYDGTEVLEAALLLLALDRAGIHPVCVAPGVEQMHVVDHLTGEEVEGEGRSVLAEAGRIARGKVGALGGFWAGDLQGLFIPGGYGVPKNLMSGFMRLGAPRLILPDVKALLDDLTGRQRPVGAVSLGRTLLAAYLGDEMRDEDLTLPATEVVVDEARRTAFTPGFLTATRVTEVARGVEGLVGAVGRMAAAGLPVLR